MKMSLLRETENSSFVKVVINSKVLGRVTGILKSLVETLFFMPRLIAGYKTFD